MLLSSDKICQIDKILELFKQKNRFDKKCHITVYQLYRIDDIKYFI